MFQSVKKSLRSWMFIYAGLVAAIALASQPIAGDEGGGVNGAMSPLIGEAPLGRADI